MIDDPRVLPHHKLALRALAGYLDLPLDVIADFIPIIGRLDDALIVSIAIRTALRSANADLIRQQWPGSQPPPNSILPARRDGRGLPPYRPRPRCERPPGALSQDHSGRPNDEAF